MSGCRFQLFRLPSILVPMLFCGCAGWGTSRWAMDDRVYEEKYDDPYTGDEVDKATRIVKQMIDARHVENRSGLYIGSSAADDPLALGAELGAFHYFGSVLEARGGLKGLAGTADSGWFLGGDFGLRLQSPSRLAPFIGVGTFLGGDGHQARADEPGETKCHCGGFASIYPEAGLHFWLNGKTRLTAGAQYHLNSQGRSNDFWFYGLSVALLEM